MRTYNSKDISHCNDQSSTFTSSIYLRSDQNNQKLLEKVLRNESETSLQRNVTENYEHDRQNFNNYNHKNLCVRAITFPGIQSENKLLLQQTHDNDDKE